MFLNFKQFDNEYNGILIFTTHFEDSGLLPVMYQANCLYFCVNNNREEKKNKFFAFLFWKCSKRPVHTKVNHHLYTFSYFCKSYNNWSSLDGDFNIMQGGTILMLIGKSKPFTKESSE